MGICQCQCQSKQLEEIALDAMKETSPSPEIEQNNQVEKKKQTDSVIATSIRSIEGFQKVKKPTDNLVINIYGARESGKTSFVIKYCEKKFDTFYIPSLGCETTNYSCVINGKRYTLKFIVDQYEQYSINTLKDSNCFLIFFDCSDSNSYIKAKEFVKEVYHHCNNNVAIPICLIGNKIDLKRKNYNAEDAKIFCNEYKIELFEISVKDNIGISKMMQYICSYYANNN